MKKSSVIVLLENWEKFVSENPRKDIYAFAQWLLSTRQEEQVAVQKPVPGNGENASRVAILITRLQKYLALNVKPTVRELGFTKEHEYNFLYQISKMSEPSKNELSKENMVEFSTGRDIIKRLIRKNLVTEKPDPKDGRASQLALTAKGRKILDKSFELMSGSFVDFLGDLSAKEQQKLINLLSRLARHHAAKNNLELLSYL
jgi:DNA-binding MarR family transcriptional regulator